MIQRIRGSKQGMGVGGRMTKKDRGRKWMWWFLAALAALQLYFVQELIAEHLAAVEKLVDAPTTTEAVPEEVKLEAPPTEAAPVAAVEATPEEVKPAEASESKA